MSCFETVIALYRYIGRPAFNGTNNNFSATLDYDEQIYRYLNVLIDKTTWGSIDEIVIDDEDVDSNDKIPMDGKLITLTISISTGVGESFFINTIDLIDKSPMLSHGELRNSFYLVEEDFYYTKGMCDSDVETKSSNLLILLNICQFIVFLSKVSHYSNSGDSSHSLVFIKNTNKKALPLIIDICVERNFLSVGLNNLEIIKNISDDKFKINDDDFFEKKEIFINTLIDFLDLVEPKKQFYHLLSKWNEFLRLYHNNLGIYLSGFSFHKIRKEVAEAEIDLAERFSKIMSDMIVKLLGIPISLAATFSMIKMNNLPEMALIFCGVLLTSYIMFLIVKSQSNQYKILCQTKEVIFSPLIELSSNATEDLRFLINNAKKNLDENQSTLGDYLNIFKLLCWVPTAMGGGMILVAAGMACVNIF